MQKFFLTIFSILVVAFIFIASSSPPPPLTHSIVISPVIPSSLSLAGEEVPLESFGVIESLDKEFIINTYRHSSTILYLKRAARWFPLIEPILEEHGVPDDFKYLAVIESGLSQVVSPAGASGFWQFMKKTAPEYDLEVSTTVDERYHVEKSTRAACIYLLKSYEQFGSWSLAAASYNMGRAGVSNRLKEQGVSNYWDLHLNAETARYVYRMIALKEVLSRPGDYGFKLTPSDLYSPHDTRVINVSSTISDLSVFALEQGSNLHELKSLNPWLRKSSLTVAAGSSYDLLLPNTVME